MLRVLPGALTLLCTDCSYFAAEELCSTKSARELLTKSAARAFNNSLDSPFNWSEICLGSFSPSFFCNQKTLIRLTHDTHVKVEPASHSSLVPWPCFTLSMRWTWRVGWGAVEMKVLKEPDRMWVNMAMLWEVYGNAILLSLIFPDVRSEAVGCTFTVFRQWAAVKAVPVADGRRCRDGIIGVVLAVKWWNVSVVSWRLNAWLMMRSCVLSFEHDFCRIPLRSALVFLFHVDSLHYVLMFPAKISDIAGSLFFWVSLSSPLAGLAARVSEFCISDRRHGDCRNLRDAIQRVSQQIFFLFHVSGQDIFYLLCWLFLLIFVVFDPKISSGRGWRHGCACCKANRDTETNSDGVSAVFLPSSRLELRCFAPKNEAALCWDGQKRAPVAGACAGWWQISARILSREVYFWNLCIRSDEIFFICI